MVPTPHDSDDKPLRIRRGRVESVDLYEIKDSELEVFRKGSPADLQLNFAIFLLSIAFTAIAALYAATFSNTNMHTTFIVIAVIGILFGIYLLISWSINRTSLTATCDLIRERIKEPDLVITSTSRTEITAVEPPKEPPE
jgi:amino acid transporter